MLAWWTKTDMSPVYTKSYNLLRITYPQAVMDLPSALANSICCLDTDDMVPFWDIFETVTRDFGAPYLSSLLCPNTTAGSSS